MNHPHGKAFWALAVGALFIGALACDVHWHEPSAKATAAAEPSSRANSAAPPASAPATVLWDRTDRGIKLHYPADWRPRKNPDYELMLLPPGESKLDRRITVDIPDLPPHLPFMIQMSRIEHDYVQDLRKQHPDLKVQQSVAGGVADSNSKLVHSVWRQNGVTWHDTVLLIIHASGVYIVDAQSGEPQLAGTTAAFDTVRGSIQWSRR